MECTATHTHTKVLFYLLFLLFILFSLYFLSFVLTSVRQLRNFFFAAKPRSKIFKI